MLKDMRPQGLEHQERMSERMKCWKLEEEEGERDIVVYRTLMPMFISNRFMISCLYHHERENGDFISVQSARANDYYYEKHGSQAKKDEIADHVISMTKVTPVEGLENTCDLS